MAEWSIAAVLKTVIPSRGSRVRIPLSPPVFAPAGLRLAQPPFAKRMILIEKLIGRRLSGVVSESSRHEDGLAGQHRKDFGNFMPLSPLFSAILKTPLGELHALADEKALIYLGFEPHEHAATITAKKNDVLTLLEHELTLYFINQLTTFTVPIKLAGTPFQQKVWQALTAIPHGQTRSYKEQAALVGNPKAYRAVGSANGANKIVIVIPCHRIIAANSTLGGYSGKLEHKQWLLNHEKK
jgi:O-6-methylguanine DNA methyltransferase